MTSYGEIRVIVEFMDGEKRTYGPVGGSIVAPRLAGDGSSTSVMELGYKPGEGAPFEHVATIPLMNVRAYRMEAFR